MKIILFVLLIAIVYGMSWVCICGIIKLITLCFGWSFNWFAATGVWLALTLLSMFVKSSGGK